VESEPPASVEGFSVNFPTSVEGFSVNFSTSVEGFYFGVEFPAYQMVS
jgi:hypothetical protein